MTVSIGCIVEGHGETEAVPILLRRIATERRQPVAIQIAAVLRIRRNRLLKEGELERSVELAARKSGADGRIFILLDADDDCPAELGPALLARARKVRADRDIGVVLAKREYESWFLAASDSLRGHRGLPSDLAPPPDPEAIRGAKEWLSRCMTVGTYVETLDQPALSAAFDITQARRADSFDKCCRVIETLLGVERER
ncbi:MAG: DUF4276 family protein [Planctomycetes bacterium]|nr:DUF4276 family protein [Planctomycetota bacterium]